MSRLVPPTIVLVAAAALLGSTGRAATGASGQQVVGAPRILYSSDWSGTSEIYAVDPSGRRPVAQLTVGRPPTCADVVVVLACGFSDPLPSPDGRRVLYRNVAGRDGMSGLWVARADGSAPLRLASGFVEGAAWAPNSRQIAILGPNWLETVLVDGSHVRTVASPVQGIAAASGNPAWSPDGRSLALAGVALSITPAGPLKIVSLPGHGLAWSPDSRRIAYVANGAVVVASSTGASPRKVGKGSAPAWSPDGKTLAFVSDGVRLLSLRSGKTRLLTRDDGSGLAWAPDGRSLAYLPASLSLPIGQTLVSNGDLRVVDLSGHTRTVVAADRAYGGRMLSFAWTRPTAGVRYRPASPAPGRRVAPDGILADGPVEFLVADGDRVAYATTCSTVSVWTPMLATVTLVRGGPFESPTVWSTCYSETTSHLSGLGLARDRGVAWVEACCTNSKSWDLFERTLETPPRTFTLGKGSGGADIAGPSVTGGHVDSPVGAGPLLVFSSWQSARDAASGHYVVTRQSIQLAGPSGCPCRTLRSDPGPLIVDDVDAGHIAAHGNNSVVVLDSSGAELASVPVKPDAVVLTENNLVVLVRGELRHYDATNGTLLRTWPLPSLPSGPDCPPGIAFGCPGENHDELPLRLQDASRGLAAYVLDGEVHVLRLADGKDATIASGTHARFMDEGLVYADGTRLHLVAYGKLPLR